MASRADSKLPQTACAVCESTDWKHIPHCGRKESAMKRKVSDVSGVPTHIPQAGIGHVRVVCGWDNLKRQNGISKMKSINMGDDKKEYKKRIEGCHNL